MRRARVPRQRSRPSRSARSWRWPANRPSRAICRSATGARANWPAKRSGAASWTVSRTARSGGFLKGADLKPHRVRGWLTPKPDPEFETKCADIGTVYHDAPAAAQQDIRTVSIDEMTGVQALERAAPDLPMQPGKGARREFEYIRHGTQTLIAAFDVVSGKVIGTVGDTRTEQDYVSFLQSVFSVGTASTKWRVVADNLNTHVSEGVVRLVADLCGRGASPTFGSGVPCSATSIPIACCGRHFCATVPRCRTPSPCSPRPKQPSRSPRASLTMSPWRPASPWPRPTVCRSTIPVWSRRTFPRVRPNRCRAGRPF